MDPIILLVIALLTVVIYFACQINAGADVPAPAGEHRHGHVGGHGDPQGEPGGVAHPHEHA